MSKISPKTAKFIPILSLKIYLKTITPINEIPPIIDQRMNSELAVNPIENTSYNDKSKKANEIQKRILQILVIFDFSKVIFI